jgi:ubiquinone/menaquinone biosynthesis C-methylase UbiE
MIDRKTRVCPVGIAGSLDNRIRRWLQDPRKILKPHVVEGMTVLDLGCGPGFFSVAIARMVGRSGRVIAADLQEGMLRKLGRKIEGTELEERIALHKCEENTLGLSEHVDLIFAFYVVHEVPDQGRLFREMDSILKPDGRVFIAEPPFHVSKTAFEETLGRARAAGLTPAGRPKVPFSRAAILKKSSS